MKRRTGVDLWAMSITPDRYATVITTNGEVKSGRATMGKGTAGQAASMWPELPRALGKFLDTCGNHCFVLPVTRNPGAYLVSFPTKHDWRVKSDLKLIERSAHELAGLADVYQWVKVFMPRPGCGAGGLDWSKVRPVLSSILDDRFVIVHDPQHEQREAEALSASRAAAKPAIKKGAVSKAAKKRMGQK